MSLTVGIAAPYTTQESGMVHGEPALLASPGCYQRKPNELLNLVLYNRDKEERIPREGTSIVERWDGQWDNSECACFTRQSSGWKWGCRTEERQTQLYLDASIALFTPLGTSQGCGCCQLHHPVCSLQRRPDTM